MSALFEGFDFMAVTRRTLLEVQWLQSGVRQYDDSAPTEN
jgi:hypothetical protein